jgi:hypothetical protein
MSIITKISITKSKTFGTTVNNSMKFNKIVITADASVAEADDPKVIYKQLSDFIDKSFEAEQPTQPSSLLNNK